MLITGVKQIHGHLSEEFLESKVLLYSLFALNYRMDTIGYTFKLRRNLIMTTQRQRGPLHLDDAWDSHRLVAVLG